jgi:hypothetical protein
MHGPTITELEEALFHVLRRVTAIRQRAMSGGGDGELEVICAADVVVRSKAGAMAANLASGDAEASERLAIRWIGERLWAHTHSTDAMLEALYRVAGRSPRWRDTWLSIVDHRWDGIGDARDVWLA